jgi:hypothetical protein
MVTFSTDDHQEVSMRSTNSTKATTFNSRPNVSFYGESASSGTIFGQSSLAAPDEQHLTIPKAPYDLVLGQAFS